MAATGFTPISIYYSSTTGTAPTAGNLVAGELALNTFDGKLFYKDSAGVVQVIATKGTGTIGGSNTQVQYNSSGAFAGSANMVFDGSTLTTLNSAYTGTLTGGTGVINIGSGQFYKDASGNVGIGTSAPAGKLHVFGRTLLRSTSDPYSLGLSYSNSTTESFYIGASSNTSPDLVFTNSSVAEKMRIVSTGELLIATTTSDSSNYKVQLGTGSSDTRMQLRSSNAYNLALVNGTGNIGAWLGSAGADTFVVSSSGGTEKLRLNTTGNLVLQGGTTSANGVGITFPATQSASTDANCLDDYEEGTWSPVLTSAGGSLTTVVNGTGYYTKIGRMVSITCRPVITTNGTGSVALLLAGLPFASSPGTNLSGAGREDAALGNTFGFSAASSSTLYIQNYDHTYPGGNGYAFPINFVYFV